MRWGIKRISNDELRQKFIDATVPQAKDLGVTLPDPDLQVERGARPLRLRRDRLGRVLATSSAATGRATASACGARVKAWEDGAWVREAALAHAAKQARAAQQSQGAP